MDEWDNNPALQLFKCVLSEAIHGCELAKELQMKMDSTQGPHLRHLVMQSSAEIISTFQNVLELLKSNPNPNSLNWGEDSGFAVEELITEEIGARGQSQMIPIKSQRHEYSASGAHSHASGSPPASDMSQGSTVPNLGISSKPKCKYAAYGSENEAASLKERVQTSKKKKPLLRWTTRIRANNSEVGNDGPPYDGHTWRKYGQKDILGALYPRSYYRCTHKNDLGCQAIKQVQRADDDSSFFEVTYRGLHSCQIDPPLLQIQMPFQDPQIGSSSHLNSSFWQDCNTSTGHGLSPTHSKPTSRQATMPLLGISSGSPITETENISDFVPYYPHLLHIPPNEGNSSSNAMQPNWPENSMQPNTSNRPAMISVSLFRKQSSEAEI